MIYDLSLDRYIKNIKTLFFISNMDESCSKNLKEKIPEIFEEHFQVFNQEDMFFILNNNNIDILFLSIKQKHLINEIKRRFNIHVICYLSKESEEMVVHGIKANVDDFVILPFSKKSLEKALNKASISIYNRHLTKIKKTLDQYQNIIFQNSIISKTDKEGVITYVNDEFCSKSGYSKSEIIGKTHSIIRHPDTPESVYKDLWDTISKEKETWQGILKNRSKNGETYYVQMSISPIFDSDGNIIEYVAMKGDLSDMPHQKKRLSEIARKHQEKIVVIVKMENIHDMKRSYDKNIAESYGVSLLWKLLEMMPDELSFSNRDVFLINDDSYVFIKDKQGCNLESSKIESLIKDFYENIRDINIDIDGMEYNSPLTVVMSLGEYALEDAKYLAQKKRGMVVCNNNLDQKRLEAQKNLDALKMIKKAVDNFQIVSYFQPIVNNATLKVDKYESLVRLIDENKNVLSPSEFLDVAKKGLYYSKITDIVLENSFKMAKENNIDISINISTIDIERADTRKKLLNLIERDVTTAKHIILELLEDEKANDLKIIKEFIAQVKKYGVKIAIDDFGSGYSNFERVLDYQPNILKIDGSLIKTVNSNKYSLSVINAIITLASEQNITMVAEYVENEEIFLIIKNMGIQYSQGYFFGKPESVLQSV